MTKEVETLKVITIKVRRTNICTDLENEISHGH